MNKIEKNITEAICKETLSLAVKIFEIKENTMKFELPTSRIVNRIGLTKDQATDFLQKFLEQGYFIKIDEKNAEGWTVTADYTKLIEMFNKSVEGNKLNTDQIRTKRAMGGKLGGFQQENRNSQINETLKKGFENGKWLRLCCASCGYFIQEITTYEGLRELEDKIVECPKNHHQNRFKQVGEHILFSSENTKILEIMKEKKVDSKV